MKFIVVFFVCFFIHGVLAQEFIQIDMSNKTTLAISSDGALWGWGDNRNKELTNRVETDRNPQPVLIDNSSQWKSVASCENSSLAIKDDGTLWSWGAVNNGILGRSVEPTIFNDQEYPAAYSGEITQVGLDADWSFIDCGSYSAIGIKKDASVWLWGFQSKYFQESTQEPQLIDESGKWRQFSIGKWGTLGVRDDGSLWGWGYGFTGDGLQRLGIENNWVNISWGSGESPVHAINSRGELWAFDIIELDPALGLWAFGEYVESDDYTKLYKTKVGFSENWKKVVSANGSNYAIQDNNTLWSWGENRWGQLGNGSIYDSSTPGQILPDVDVVDVFASVVSEGAIAIDSEGNYWGWGTNSSGQLATGYLYSSDDSPQLVDDSLWSDLSTGPATKPAGRKNSGNWNHWGSGEYFPSNISYSNTWESLSVSETHHVALGEGGEVFGWGDNAYGALGHSFKQEEVTPVLISEDKSWKKVDAGLGFTLFLKEDGSLWIQGTILDRNYTSISQKYDAITQIETDTKWTNFFVRNQSIALVDDSGFIWGMGSYTNTNGYIITSKVANKIIADGGWSSVAIGSYHFLAIKNDGSLWSWGRNNDGQLGLGSTAQYLEVKQVSSESWIDVAAAGSVNYAIKSDNTLWSWGEGPLGHGEENSKLVPTKIKDDSKWKKVSISSSAIHAIDGQGKLWGWGDNRFGAMGIQTWIAPNPARILVQPQNNFDLDGDGMPAAWEVAHGFSDANSDDANIDSDSDGLSNIEEYTYGTDPNLEDTDGDGLIDSLEISMGNNPLIIDYSISFSAKWLNSISGSENVLELSTEDSADCYSNQEPTTIPENLFLLESVDGFTHQLMFDENAVERAIISCAYHEAKNLSSNSKVFYYIPENAISLNAEFFNPSSNIIQSSVIRVSNASSKSGAVILKAVDDLGVSSIVSFDLGAYESKTFRSSDLEFGSSDKGLLGEIGDGIGKWSISIFSGDFDVGGDLKVTNLQRSPYGDLVNISASLESNEGDGLSYHLPFIPAATVDETTALVRIVNTNNSYADITLKGYHLNGDPADSDIMLRLSPNESKTITAKDLEQGNISKGISDQLVFGEGRQYWSIELFSEFPVKASIIYRDESTGVLTSLNGSVDVSSDPIYFFNPASNQSQQSELRLVNFSFSESTVVVNGIDDNGNPGDSSIDIKLNGYQSLVATAEELEVGSNRFLGKLGDGSGKWRLLIDAQESVSVSSVVSNIAGVFENMSNTLMNSSDTRFEVSTFNPASNLNQRSVLRVYNNNSVDIVVDILARDDNGNERSVTVPIAANSTTSLTALDLENGNPNKGILYGVGDGIGKWSLVVTSNYPIKGFSFVRTPSGNVFNMSSVLN